MGKWYKQGFQDAIDGLPIDPPMHPKPRDYVNYCEGFVDGEWQLSLDAECDPYGIHEERRRHP